jgi:hypothetical protein
LRVAGLRRPRLAWRSDAQWLVVAPLAAGLWRAIDARPAARITIRPARRTTIRATIKATIRTTLHPPLTAGKAVTLGSVAALPTPTAPAAAATTTTTTTFAIGQWLAVGTESGRHGLRLTIGPALTTLAAVNAIRTVEAIGVLVTVTR